MSIKRAAKITDNVIVLASPGEQSKITANLAGSKIELYLNCQSGEPSKVTNNVVMALRGLPLDLLELWSLIFGLEQQSKKREGCNETVGTLARLTRARLVHTRENLWRLEKCHAIRIEQRPGEAHRIYCTPERFDPSLLTFSGGAQEVSAKHKETNVKREQTGERIKMFRQRQKGDAPK